SSTVTSVPKLPGRRTTLPTLELKSASSDLLSASTDKVHRPAASHTTFSVGGHGHQEDGRTSRNLFLMDVPVAQQDDQATHWSAHAPEYRLFHQPVSFPGMANGAASLNRFSTLVVRRKILLSYPFHDSEPA